MARARRWLLAAGVLVGCSGDPGDGEELPDPCEVSGSICTWLGRPGVAILSADDLDRYHAGLYLPQDVIFTPEGVAYVADFNNHRVRRVGLDGNVTTVTGTGVPGDGPQDRDCDVGACVAHESELWHPSQMVLDPGDPDILIGAAWHNHRLIRIDVVRDEVEWLVGTGVAGYQQAPPILSYPSSVVVDADGSLIFSDQGNQLIRRLTDEGVVDVAGQPGVGGYSGDGGLAIDAELHGHGDWVGGPTSKLELAGRTLYVADSLNGVIRAIDLDTGSIETVAGKFVDGDESGSAPGYAGDGGPAIDATFHIPRDLAFGHDGELYVADTGNHCVRVIRPDGTIETFAGRCGESGIDGDTGPAVDALMDTPCGVAVDGEGAVYVSDSNNHVVRRIAR
jgi:sugar lactone lactonase YvrE